MIYQSQSNTNKMRLAPHTLRTKVTAKEKKEHEIYVLKCKIIECKKHIDFYTEILNNPKANIELQRNMLLNIESEELKIYELNNQLYKTI